MNHITFNIKHLTDKINILIRSKLGGNRWFNIKCFMPIENGFTLVELLIVVALVGIIGTITTQVFILGIHSQSKTEMMKEIKQNGDFTLSVMEGMIINALDVGMNTNQCNTNSKQLTILNPDGFTTMFDCNSNVNISSVSGIYVPDPNPTPTGIPLTNSRVKVPSISCNFRLVCPSLPLTPKYVYITFTVDQADVPGITPNPLNRATLNYQSTVSLRNYQ